MDIQVAAQILGNFGEFVGAVAVLVTLIYLARQVGENARSSESNAIAQAASDHQANMRLIAENPNLAMAWDKANRGEDLSHEESVQLTWWAYCLVRGAETHVQVAKLGMVPEYADPWEAILRDIARQNSLAKGVMINWVGSATFKSWLNERVLS